MRQESVPDEERELCLHTVVTAKNPLIPIDRYSSFTRLKRITAWVLRFIRNCSSRKLGQARSDSCLTVVEMDAADKYWVSLSQECCFAEDIAALKGKGDIALSSPLLPLHPFLDSSDIVRVGGRTQNARLPYHTQHQIVLSGKHPVAKLIILTEHLRLLHAGPTLLGASLVTNSTYLEDARSYDQSHAAV
jgi:hypothetical protein